MYPPATTSTLSAALVRRGRLVALLFLLLAALPAQAQVAWGPGLQQAVQAAAPDLMLEVIVTFEGDGPLSAGQLGALRGLGITRGVFFRELPIAGVLATPAQVQALARLAGVRSLWPNSRLSYENEQATALTGVDRLRADARLRNAQGLPYSGKGIGVLVNDSGIDGLHPDHRYPDHVVQNVAGQLNLHAFSDLLPYTPQEGVANTDIGGGHGTHVAGIIAGTGAASGGKHEGVAPGASLIGYGSGAGLFILDTIGGFDWALTNQFRYNIRVISNSFGNTGDVGTDFNPDDPTNVATKKCADRGMVVVFSAGNSGPGESTITGNFKKAPWVVTVAAGDKQGLLAGFSSRGRAGRGGTALVGGVAYDWVDRPTVTAPGVSIISTRASTSALSPLSATVDAELIEPAFLPYYTTMDGTSMACPHVSGIVALMLEANPRLDVYDVRRLLEATATNMPGRKDYEVGAGYVNAYAAVVAALGLRADFGSTLNLRRAFNSSAQLNVTEQDFTLAFDPSGVGARTYTFQVDRAYAQIAAHVDVRGVEGETGNSLGLRLVAPDGTRYTSGVSALFVLTSGRDVVVDNPMQGTWRVELYGVNGVGLPETTEGYLRLKEAGSFTGLGDIAGHPAEGAIQAAVAARLADGLAGGLFRPDEALTRAHLAQYLVMGAGLRQSLPLEGGFTFADVSAEEAPFAEAAAATGAALKDRAQRQAGVIRVVGAQFRPGQAVLRQELAYALVQSLGLQEAAQAFSGSLTAELDGERVTVDDQAQIAPELRGYVQLALDLGLLNAYFRVEQGPFELKPRLVASFRPAETVTRGAYAVAATRLFAKYELGDLGITAGPAQETTLPGGLLSRAGEEEGGAPEAFTLSQNYPNPFNPATEIRFTLPEAGAVRLVVYDLTGRQVRVLTQGRMEAGAHALTFEAGGLASGTYVYRLETPRGALTRTMLLLK